MSLVLRIPKGSALTNAELDNNFTYLESNSINLLNALIELTGKSADDIKNLDVGKPIPILEDDFNAAIDTKQDLNGNLTSLSNLNSNGLLTKTGDDTIISRNIEVLPGLVITNSSGLNGNPTIGLDTNIVATIDGQQSLTNKVINGNLNFINNVSINTSTVGILSISRGGTGSNNAFDACMALNALISPTNTGIVIKASNTSSVSRQLQVQGSGISITNANGIGGNPTIVLESNTRLSAFSLVLRDEKGNFEANLITASLNGLANRATKLEIARLINNVPFDGTSNITIFDETKLTLTGGSLSGYLTLHANPILNLHAATKGYVDSSLSAYVAIDNTKLPLAGGLMSGFITLHKQPESTMHAATKSYVDTSVSNITVNPVGTVIIFAGASPPNGYLECGGQLVSKTTYSALYNIIGNMYGLATGDTFRLPDLRGEFVRGWDNNRGVDSARQLGSWQKGSIVAYDEAFDALWTASTVLDGSTNSPSAFGLDPGFTGSLYPDARLTGGLSPSSFGRISDFSYNTGSRGWYGVVRPRNVSMMYCIKF